jgi:hypothetical protein
LAGHRTFGLGGLGAGQVFSAQGAPKTKSCKIWRFYSPSFVRFDNLVEKFSDLVEKFSDLVDGSFVEQN